MIYLNLIFFLLITWYGYKFLLSDGAIVTSPFDKKIYMQLDGPELFWVLTFSTGLFCLSAPLGLDLMAIRLGVLELMCIIGLKYTRNKPVWSFPIIVYSLYLLWILIGCFYSPSPGYGIRVVLKYLYILPLSLFASAAVSDELTFFKSAILARWVAIFAIGYYFIPLVGTIFPGLVWYATAGCINFISMMIFSLAMFFFTNGKEKRKNLIFTIIFLIPCFVFVFRTSIMGSTLAIMVFFLFKDKVKAVPGIAGVLIAAILLVFAIPSVRDKMFFDSKDKSAEQLYDGEISMDQVNSNGRFAMWEWSLQRFWEPRMAHGTGTGNLQETFYSLRHPFATIRICHNDYVQILCDNGLIGIILFGASFLLMILHCFRIYCTSFYPDYIKLGAITAGASLAGVMFTLYTDNVVNYSMATLSMPWGFYGMTLGMIRKFNDEYAV